jgi:hypothetical protein
MQTRCFLRSVYSRGCNWAFQEHDVQSLGSKCQDRRTTDSVSTWSLPYSTLVSHFDDHPNPISSHNFAGLIELVIFAYERAWRSWLHAAQRHWRLSVLNEMAARCANAELASPATILPHKCSYPLQLLNFFLGRLWTLPFRVKDIVMHPETGQTLVSLYIRRSCAGPW